MNCFRMNNQNLNEFIKKVVNYSFDANKYFNDSEPWSVKKTGYKKKNSKQIAESVLKYF